MSSAYSTLASTIVGGGLTIAGGQLLEWHRNKRQDAAEWRAVQVAAILELQEELVIVKTMLAMGNDAETVRDIPDLATVPARNRAIMLCSRIDDDALRERIWRLLVESRQKAKNWRQGQTSDWQDVINELDGFQQLLGNLRRHYHPKPELNSIR